MKSICPFMTLCRDNKVTSGDTSDLRVDVCKGWYSQTRLRRRLYLKPRPHRLSPSWLRPYGLILYRLRPHRLRPLRLKLHRLSWSEARGGRRTKKLYTPLWVAKTLGNFFGNTPSCPANPNPIACTSLFKRFSWIMTDEFTIWIILRWTDRWHKLRSYPGQVGGGCAA